MSKILISNNVPFHYDIIQSMIEKYDELLKIEKDSSDTIDLYMVDDYSHVTPNLNFIQLKRYLSQKYKIRFIDSVDYSIYDYEIHGTAAKQSAPETDGGIRPEHMIDDNKRVYISHDVDEELLSFSNVMFLSNFGREDIPMDRIFIVDRLPEVCVEKNIIPNIVIQGSFVRSKFDRTRDYSILEDILSIDYELDFKITIVGAWHQPDFNINEFIDMPRITDSNKNRINVLLNKDWKTFNSICANADLIAPLVSKKEQPHCFSNKITSSIFYGRGYQVRMFVDDDFVKAYNLTPEQSVVYNRDRIQDSFKEFLEDFYKNKG